MIWKYKHRKILIILITAILISGFCYVLYILLRPGETRTFKDHYYFSIDSDTIVSALQKGEANVFVQIDQTSYVDKPWGEAVEWKESDYIYVAQALHEFVWGEASEEWGISQIAFGLDCDDIEKGFQDIGIKLFKVSEVNTQPVRLISSISVSPSYGSSTLFTEEYFPVRRKWQTIDLNALSYTAQNALEIAEQNGGRKIRSDNNDACFISIFLIHASDVSCSGWDVKYYSNSDDFLGDYCVDTQTGGLK